MNWSQTFNNYKTFRYLGVFLIAFSSIIWIISIIEIVGNDLMLSNAQTYGLTIEEIWRYEGANKWWNQTYGTVILPATLTLALSGILAILSPKLLSFTKKIMSKDYRFDNIEQKEFSKKNNLMNNANGIKKTLTLKENTMNEDEINISSFREKWQVKIEEDIQLKENNIQKLRIEINDLKYAREELEKTPLTPQELK